MKKTLALALVLLGSSALYAQTSVHGTDHTVTRATDDAPTSVYKIYRTQLAKATDVCSLSLPFIQVAQTAPGGNTASDNTVTAGGLYCFYATHVLNGIESAPSPFSIDAKTGLTVIKIPGPNAPGGDSVTSR
jgi:hypothetical protein